MPADIKGMLDAIIDGANNKFPNTVNSTLHQNPGVQMPTTFDAGKFREKLSLYVLKDIVCAMMHDDTKDLDGMIDQSIMKHIHDDYGCTCYDYLHKAQGALGNSPVLSDIIQEIDSKTMQIQSKVVDTQDDSFTNDAANLKEELKNIENYDELRKRIKDIVSQKVVNDVTVVITKSNDAPVFSDLDEKLAERKTSKPETDEEEDVTKESVIFRITGQIVAESALEGNRISTEEGMERAIVEYCMCHMDYLFKLDPSMRHLNRY
jgi:hypothetical protein